MNDLRTDWTIDEVSALYKRPLIDLIYEAGQMHRKYHDPNKIQVCDILSIKTGGCQEDCGYCSQSSSHDTFVKPERMIDVKKVVDKAKAAKEGGCTRFCMGAAWRDVKEGKQLEQVLQMVREVNALGLQVCCTLGMASKELLDKLKEAGCYAYNHNVDTGPEYYPQVVTTRTYQERLDTLRNARDAGLSVCCGGILGIGESEKDRIDMLHVVATFTAHPDSFPVNVLERVEGTRLADSKPPSIWELVRFIAVARLVMPASIIRLSAGRRNYSVEGQSLCLLAGANSVWSGKKILTTQNADAEDNVILFKELGLKPLGFEEQEERHPLHCLN